MKPSINPYCSISYKNSILSSSSVSLSGILHLHIGHNYFTYNQHL
jgi:hypothetical protein